ncbi:MAG: hypothetical protein FWC47_07040 [Oscillospiraceae bacterium]|nr:hypothetical protein [Oscillospiraceae bacterium]
MGWQTVYAPLLIGNGEKMITVKTYNTEAEWNKDIDNVFTGFKTYDEAEKEANKLAQEKFLTYTPSKEEKRNEALSRLNMLKLHPNVKNDFKNEGKINKSEGCGLLFWLDEKEQEYVNEFQDIYCTLVYHVIVTNFQFGKCFSILYVSAYKDEWEIEIEDLENNCPIAYVKNLDDPESSEFGAIKIESRIGGLVRLS